MKEVLHRPPQQNMWRRNKDEELVPVLGQTNLLESTGKRDEKWKMYERSMEKDCQVEVRCASRHSARMLMKTFLGVPTSMPGGWCPERHTPNLVPQLLVLQQHLFHPHTKM